jgi:hypothetical protein
MADRKLRMALLSRYSRFHTARYEERPSLNLNVEQWAADMLIESYGLEECYVLLEYYFSASPNPSWKFFANNADKILSAKEEVAKDIKERAIMRERARAWLND